LQLPAELRDQIYAYALGGIVWSVNGRLRAFAYRNDKIDRSYAAIGGVCRQFHDDTKLLPLCLNTFLFLHPGYIAPFIAKLNSRQKAAVFYMSLRTYVSISPSDLEHLGAHSSLYTLPNLRLLDVIILAYSGDSAEKIEVAEKDMRSWLEQHAPQGAVIELSIKTH